MLPSVDQLGSRLWTVTIGKMASLPPRC